MNSERHFDARLEGYNGPYFTPALDKLQQLISTHLLSNGELRDAAVHVPDFDMIPQAWAQTSDGYTWFSQLHFVTSSGRIIVLLPWSRRAATGTVLLTDRDAAVYTSHEDEFEVDRVVDAFNRALQDYIAKRVSLMWAIESEQVRPSPQLSRYMRP